MPTKQSKRDEEIFRAHWNCVPPKMAVEVVPDPGGFRENNTQDPTTQRRRARYPPPTPPQAQVACPVSKEAGRQAGRKLAGIFGGAGGVSPQRAASDSSRPGAGSQGATCPPSGTPRGFRRPRPGATTTRHAPFPARPPPSCRPRAGDDDS